MKKNILSLLLLFIGFCQAQVQSNEEDVKSWYHQNQQKTGVYGVGSTDAHLKLKSLKMTPTPLVVAVIDSGVDSMHEDLKDNMWVNKKEIPNNKIDDDKNGYIDDINGWNFIGNANGENVNGDTMELTRLYAENKAFFETSDSKINEKNIANNKEKYGEYLKIREDFLDKSISATRNYDKYEQIYDSYKKSLNTLSPYFEGKKITEENIKSISDRTDIGEDTKKSLDFLSFQLNRNPEAKNMDFSDFKANLLEELQEAVDHFSTGAKFHYNTELDTRKIVKDDYKNLLEKNYGNNDVKGPDALHGTHVAGIISATRNNKIGMDGIAGNHVKIMSIRTVPDGDERDKDVANAIFYAVDNGAKIINMSFGKGYSPNKERVWDAMKYAQKKNVLLVHAAGNSNEDIDKSENYPTNYAIKGVKKEIIDNFITVGASTKSATELKASFSNFGKIEVDIFAPGSEIYSTTPENNYKFLQGTSMASPVIAGCAALLWSYFPKLKVGDIKKILLLSVNKNNQITDLSKSGGIIDVNKAIETALKYKTKK